MYKAMLKTKKKKNNKKRRSIGFDLFLRKQFISNPRTKLEFQLFFRSNVYYKLSVLKDELYIPSEHIIINIPKTNNIFEY